MLYVFGEILVWLLAALFLGGGLAVLWMRLIAGARGNEQLATLSDRIAALEIERDGLRREVGEVRDRATERETQLSALNDDLKIRNARIADQASEIEKLREMGAASGHPSGDDSGSEVLRIELEAIRQRIARRDAEIADLNAELANAREAYHHLKAAQLGIAEPVPPAAAGPLPDAPETASPSQDTPTIPSEGLVEPSPAPDTAATAPSLPKSESQPIASARPAKAAEPASHDDLTRIRGIGQPLRDKLNALGVTTYAQIAAFSPEDVARIGAELTPKGRIERDDWIAQATALLGERAAS